MGRGRGIGDIETLDTGDSTMPEQLSLEKLREAVTTMPSSGTRYAGDLHAAR